MSQERGEPQISEDRRRSPQDRSRSRSPERRSSSRGDGRDYRSRNRSRSRSPIRRDDESTNPGNNLHISQLSSRTRDEDLRVLFEKIGKVEKADVMIDPHTRESRRFAFIRMSVVEDAQRAIDELNGAEVDGRAIRVERAKRNRPRTPTPGDYHGPPKDRERGLRGPPRYRGYRDDYRDDRRYERPYERRPRYDDRYERRVPFERYDRRGDNGYDRYDGPPRASRYEEPRQRPRSPY